MCVIPTLSTPRRRRLQVAGLDPNAPVVTGGFGGAKIDSSQHNGTSVANGARWKTDGFYGSAP
jgi:hypothetical protein